MFRPLRCAAVAAVFLTGLALAAENPFGEKGGEKPALDGELARGIDVIKTSKAPGEINDAYRGLREKYAASPELHRAYMVRMLKYGMIPLAHGAAERLVAADPYDGLAWGVKAYVDGKAGRFGKALESAVPAAKHEAENAPVLTALGQLVAWHENTPKAPALSEPAKRTLEDLTQKLKANEAYKAAYDALTKAYGEAGERRKGLEDRAAALRTQGVDADKEFRSLGQQFDANKRQIDDLKSRNAQLRAEIARLTAPVTPTAAPAKGAPAPAAKQRVLTPQEAATRDSDWQNIRTNENTIRELSGKNDTLNRTGSDLRAKAKRITAELNRVSEDLRVVTANIDKAMKWDPPAVDGVVTPPKDSLPDAAGSSKGSGLAGPGRGAAGSGEEGGSSSGDAPAAGATSAPAGGTERGERDYRMAQMHVQNGDYDLARRKLEAIISQYPDTPLAAKARELQERIKFKK